MEIQARFCLALCLVASLCLPASADTLLWQDINPVAVSNLAKQSKTKDQNIKSDYQNSRFLSLDVEQMTAHLNDNDLLIKSLRSKQISGVKNTLTIDLPHPDGSLITVSIAENNLLPTSLGDKYPQIKMFSVLPDDLIVSGKLDMTISGFHAMLQTRKGETFFIDPVGNSVYASYKKSDQKQSGDTGFSCSASSQSGIIENLSEKSSRSTALKVVNRTQKSLINYRIAIAATGEYTAKQGGTVAGALSAIATTINRVNQVFEQDLGIHLSLVENNDRLIYTDADADPYSGNDSQVHLSQNQQNIDSIIGAENYDIGHLFGIKGGGLASVASACDDSRKSKGVSGVSNPSNDSFNLDFVAHEIGHQFGATHTFNGVQGLCAGDTRTAKTAFEPGSGSTIMSYAGFCGQDNLQSNTDAMFHIGSIRQIRAYVTSDKNSNCGVHNDVDNASPQVEAGSNYIIPAQTPFELVGEATDLDDDSLIYAWEQVDAGEVSSVDHDRGDNALFRVHPLSNTKVRSFPPTQNLLDHINQRGENLPIQQRLMKFRLVVQDSHNTTQSDIMSVQVQRTGSRFALHLPRSQYSLGETRKILWNVAGTDVSPINCSSVELSLSVDGGYHFDEILGEGLPNTGEAWVTIPATSPSTSQGRFRISCSDNIFFAVSYRDFVLNDQNHVERLILSDEDQPENDLNDADLSKVNYTKYAEPGSPSEAGGSLIWLWMLLSLIAVRRFKTE